MRVLVTGGAGFIGSHVVEALAASGHVPVILDLLDPALHPTGLAPTLLDYEVIRGDIRDAGAVAAALRGVGAVIHQAARVGLGVDAADLPRYVGDNDLGTAVLLAVAADRGIRRLVLASSMVVYGEGAYACVEHGMVAPSARRRTELDAGRFEPPCPHCGRPLTPGRRAALPQRLRPADAEEHPIRRGRLAVSFGVGPG